MTLRIANICFAFCLSLAVSGSVNAEDEQDIKIRYGDDKTIYEYRVKGELVEIKIVPKVGPVYYLVRTEEGDFERSENSKLVFPGWKIIEW
jgi:hypothetical protein